MPRRRTETTASSLLGAWTDSDTAMQIVGTSLGMFGAGLLEPEAVLSSETPLRNALFDVLLSLVEGGALDMRPTDDGRYAFRWRADYAVAGLSPETSSTIDIDVPSPYLAEVARLERERDDALGRAEFAEGLADERERLLRLAEVPSPSTRNAKRRGSRAQSGTFAGLDPEDQSVLDVLYAARDEGGAEAPSGPAARATTVDEDEIDIREPDVREVDIRDDVRDIDDRKVEARTAEARKAEARKAEARKSGARKRKPAGRAPAPDDDEPDEARPGAAESDESTSSDVLWLTPPTAWPESSVDPTSDSAGHLDDEDDASPGRPRWSGYTIDKARAHLWGVDRLADEG